LLDQARSLFNASGIKDAKGLLDILGLTVSVHIGIGLIGLIKLLKRRRPESVTTLSNGNVQIVVNGI
jgi:hypothetical protein